jgi:flavin-dependent dehydrogenase
MMSSVQRVVIVGGGTAGWLSACYLAARRPDLSITLVEAPDIPTIGVGEGTWPTMRETLATIGIPESDFLQTCDASFKQGSRFDGWVDGSAGDQYLHPFTPPPPAPMQDLLAAWQAGQDPEPFAAAMTPQYEVCRQNLAPRQRVMPDYAGALNYGYHLDAGKFAARLRQHAVERLAVRHVSARVTGLSTDDRGDITELTLEGAAALPGDVFIDCSGSAALLIEGHFKAGWVDLSHLSFNDRALAVQAPVAANSPIASQTISTAHEAGWIWDIALPTRRGIGCVYSSRFMSDDQANTVLRRYLAERAAGVDASKLTPRKLAFKVGHRAEFWKHNCLAIGLSAGFIEPLEASAIVLIELSLRALADNFPASRQTLSIHADRFNALFTYRWGRIVDFLKLHYALSQRPEPYWRAQRDPSSLPDRLRSQLALWREQPPSAWDFPQIDEIFSAFSQQYVLYGMGYAVPSEGGSAGAAVDRVMAEVRDRSRALAAALPSNEAYLAANASQTSSRPSVGECVRT